MVPQRHLETIDFLFLSLKITLTKPQIEHIPVLCSSFMSDKLCVIFIHRARDLYQIATTDTGSIKEIPDQFVVFKGCHNVEYLRATRTDVDRT